MKKTLVLFCWMLALALPTGCGPVREAGETPRLERGAVETPVPTPEPQGLRRIFGKDVVTIAYLGEDAGAFLGAQAEAKRLGVPLLEVFSVEEANGADVVIADNADVKLFTKLTVPVILLAEENEENGGAQATIAYEREGATDGSLDALLAYSGHEAPVRVLGLFTGKDSEAAGLYRDMEDEGKLYSRGEFGGASQEAGEWTLETLGDIPVGLLDSIYCETPELAMAAFQALQEADRSGAVEVICCGVTGDVLSAMLEDHFLMGGAVGPNIIAAGALSVRMAVAYLAGEPVEDVVLLREVFQSEELILASRAAQGDLTEILLERDEALFGLYQGEAAQYLAAWTAVGG